MFSTRILWTVWGMSVQSFLIAVLNSHENHVPNVWIQNQKDIVHKLITYHWNSIWDIFQFNASAFRILDSFSNCSNCSSNLNFFIIALYIRYYIESLSHDRQFVSLVFSLTSFLSVPEKEKIQFDREILKTSNFNAFLINEQIKMF